MRTEGWAVAIVPGSQSAIPLLGTMLEGDYASYQYLVESISTLLKPR
jgi:ubiquinone/menaquinone biosynthesis C-methylase UbiE